MAGINEIERQRNLRDVDKKLIVDQYGEKWLPYCVEWTSSDGSEYGFTIYARDTDEAERFVHDLRGTAVLTGLLCEAF